MRDSKLQDINLIVSRNLDDFVKFPKHALLFWPGCIRGRKTHNYPKEIRLRAKDAHPMIKLDGRSNGPAIAAYLAAEGERPKRAGSSNKWSIHHLYFGQFAHEPLSQTLHAVKEKLHFTQSAGLVAVHPIADALCHEVSDFTWFLRKRAFEQFGYDPDQVFGKDHDKYGFEGGKHLSPDKILLLAD